MEFSLGNFVIIWIVISIIIEIIVIKIVNWYIGGE